MPASLLHYERIAIFELSEWAGKHDNLIIQGDHQNA